MNKTSAIIYILSFSFSIAKGQIINMPTSGWQTYNTCHGVFYDSGGEFGSYSNNEHGFLTFCPDDTGQYVALLFYGGNIAPGPGDDVLYIRKGPDTNGVALMVYSGIGPNLGDVIVSTDPTGCLTIQFDSDSSLVYSGWKASILCYPWSPPPLNLPGSNCTYAISVSLPYNVLYETTLTYGNDQFNSQPNSCATYTQGADKFYKYVSSGSECLTVSLSNMIMPFPNSHTSLSVWYGCPGSGGYCVGSYSQNVNPPTLPSLTGNFNLDSAGTYYIIVDTDDPSISQFVQYDMTVVQCSVGVAEPSAPTAFIISTNPSDGIFTLQTNSIQESELVITNMLGETVLRQKIDSEITQINLKNHSKGVYLATLMEKNKNRLTRKIVKM